MITARFVASAFISQSPLPVARPLSHHRFTCSVTSPPPSFRTAAITGASGGIGLETAKGLIRTLPDLEHLYLLCRNTDKTEAAVAPLREGSVVGKKVPITVLPVELASATSVSHCADTLLQTLQTPLDLLVCNAGIMATPLMYTDNEGETQFKQIEMQYAVNHLSHALLTEKLKASMKEGGIGRAIFVSSLAVNISRNRKTAPLISERTAQVLDKGGYGRWQMYGDSKLAMSLYARALANMGDIEAVSLHPGVVATELSRYILPQGMQRDSWLAGLLAKVLRLRTPEEGARLSVDLSGREKVEGEFYADVGRVDKNSAPMLEREEEVRRCYEDTMRFVNAFS